jgi:putative transposase
VVNIGKRGTNNIAIWVINKRAISIKKIKIRQCKYLNNIVEQDHRNVKRRIRIKTGFKQFESAQRTLGGIEVVSVIRKNQIGDSRKTTFKTFVSLAA